MQTKIISAFSVCLTSCLISACVGTPNPSLPGDAVWDESSCRMIDADGASVGLGNLAVETLQLSDSTTLYYPTNIATSQCQFNVIGWGNGTTGFGGDAYPDLHEHWASYGFVIAVAHTNMALNNDAVLQSVEEAFAAADDPANFLHNKLKSEIGLAGKSQGGIAATAAEADARVTAIVAISGAKPVTDKPTMFLSGTEDFAYQNVANAYSASSAASVFAVADGVSHMAIVDHWGVRELATSWLRCYLQNYQDACTFTTSSDLQTEAWAEFDVSE